MYPHRYRTSAEVKKINVLPYESISTLVPHDLVQTNLRDIALNPGHPIIRGTGQRPDIFFQGTVAAQGYYDALPGIVQETMDEVGALTGRKLDLIGYEGHPEADRVLVMMGSSSETTETAVRYMNDHLDEKVGVVKVRLYRPFPAQAFLDAIPDTVTKICVMDRTREDGASGGPLYLDCLATLAEADALQGKKLVAGVYGLASKEYVGGKGGGANRGLLLAPPGDHRLRGHGRYGRLPRYRVCKNS